LFCWKDDKTQKIEIEGVVKFFEQLGLDLMDATTLIVSYYFGAKKSVKIANNMHFG